MIVTITGPSGAGKSSYFREAQQRFPDWKLITSLTSRKPREKDLPGEYDCEVTSERFAALQAQGDLLWIVQAHGHTYATTRSSVLAVLGSATPSFMILVPESVHKLRDFVAQTAPHALRNLTHVYAYGPDEAALRRRLTHRKEHDAISDEEIERRLADCREWDSNARLAMAAGTIPYRPIPGRCTVAQGAELMISYIRPLLSAA